MTENTWNTPGHVAVITGGASGIGLAAATTLLDRGMRVAIADHEQNNLDAAVETLRAKAVTKTDVLGVACDVADPGAVQSLRDTVLDKLGPVRCLMNNAGSAKQCGAPWENPQDWKQLLATNLWGVVHGCQAFIPGMLDTGADAVVVNTGSKQGITKPPGNYAYNLCKAGVVAYTECLAHALRQRENCQLNAHLLVPGFTYTGMTQPFFEEMPAAAWTPRQVVDFMLDCLAQGDFYILCPDNDVSREMDEKRIQWAAGDLIHSRPALSRWHPDYEQAFAEFMQT